MNVQAVARARVPLEVYVEVASKVVEMSHSSADTRLLYPEQRFRWNTHGGAQAFYMIFGASFICFRPAGRRFQALLKRFVLSEFAASILRPLTWFPARIPSYQGT
jgi:hypothetical protein